MTHQHKRKKRASPTQRVSPARARTDYKMEVTERELDLWTFLASGVGGLTTDQIVRFYYGGNRTKANDRLKRQFHNGYVWRSKIHLGNLGFRDGGETFFYTLDRAGAEVLARHRGVPLEEINWQPSGNESYTSGLFHNILNNDIRLAIRMACHREAFRVTDWETDLTIRQKLVEQKWVVDFIPSYGTEIETGEIVPDDYLTIVTPEHRYLNIIEIDTGSEVRQPQQRPQGADTSIATKCRRYISFLHKEKRSVPSTFEKLTGQEQKGIRVFFVTTGGETGLNSLLNCVKAVGGRNSYWATRYDLARREDLVLTRPIWRKSGDDDLSYYPWIGRSKLEEVRHRLYQYGVEPDEIEARITSIVDLARSQISARRGEREFEMRFEQAVALRSDELAEAVLKRFKERLEG